jgi:hypothetical protein
MSIEQNGIKTRNTVPISRLEKKSIDPKPIGENKEKMAIT